MAQIETNYQRREGLTFVRARVTNDRSTPQRVRVQTTVDGPTWAPHRGTVSAPEWRDDTWESTIRPDQTVGLGFVTPAEPAEPLLDVVSEARASPDDTTTESAEDVMARLDSARPPSDVLSRDP